MTEDVRPVCIFCGHRFTYEPTPAGPDFFERRRSIQPCPDPRSKWGHVEFWGSTNHQRDARFGPPVPVPTADEFAQAKANLEATFDRLREEAKAAAAPEPSPQMGFGL